MFNNNLFAGRVLVATATVLLVSLATTFAAQADNRFTYEDVFDLELVADPQFSPDGGNVVYVRRSMDIMTDRPRSNLWIVDRDGGNHRPLVSGTSDAFSPRFSPDGNRLAYVSTHEGSAQLYVRWMDSGQTARISNLQRGPQSMTWSPDGKYLAFGMFVPDSAPPMIEMLPAPKGAEWAAPSKEIDALFYRADGRGYLEQGYNHIFIVPADGGSPRQITKGDFNYGSPVWTRNGNSILAVSNQKEDWQYDSVNSDIFIVDIATGETTQLTDRQGTDAEPAISPDGRRIAYIGADDDGKSYRPNKLYVMDRDGSNTRVLTAELDRSVANPQWAEDGRSILVQYTDFGVIKVARIGPDGEIDVVADDVGSASFGRPYASGTYRSDGDKGIIYTRISTSSPADLVYSTLSGRKTRLTALNDDVLDYRDMGDVEEIRFPSSFDGREVSAWVTTPPDFDPTKKYPLILEIHGGPFLAYGPHFSPEIQLMAAEGYVVVYVNPRGSASYGTDFANYIHQNYPSEDYNDLMDAVDAVVAKGYIDEQHLFVTGGSGGGVLTAWIVGNTDRFRAAVVAKPVINWSSFVLISDGSALITKYWMGGLPWERPEHYWKYSPLSLAGNITTPTMLLTGEDDFRTPLAEPEQLYKALKLRKIDTALVQVPGASHLIAARPSNLIRKVKYILAWFEKYRTKAEETQ